MENIYYDDSDLLSKKDLDGLEPSIYIVTGNRSAGKTTNFLKKSLELHTSTGKQTILLYRYSYELSSANEIYTDVLNIYPQFGIEVKTRTLAKGLFYEMTLIQADGTESVLGFAISLNSCDQMKKYSPLFFNVVYVIMDEFQLENGKYLPNEIEKFQSLLLTIARGGGKLSRDIKVFLLGNMCSLMNPYFIFFDIHKRLKSNTKFIRGHGWLAEFTFNENASKAIKENGIGRVFANTDYMKFSTESVYLVDATVFIEKPSGKAKYICTIKHDGCMYGVWEYYEKGFIFITKTYEQKNSNILVFNSSDHNASTMMISRYSYFWDLLKEVYDMGKLRFDSMASKNATFDILALKL